MTKFCPVRYKWEKHTVYPPYPRFHFLQFWIPAVNHDLKMLSGKLEWHNEFSLHSLLSNIATLYLLPTCE
jgi:hypothetical protein